MNAFTEESYENAVMSILGGMGWDCVDGRETPHSAESALYDECMREALRRLNAGLPDEALEDAERRVRELSESARGSLPARNKDFTRFFQDGVDVSYYKDGEERGVLVRLCDFENIENNDFTAARQWALRGIHAHDVVERRPDIILFVNGFPLVLIELKSPVREETGAHDAYAQIQNYMHDIPAVFAYNQICVASDGTINKAGTITAREERYSVWKTRDGKTEDAGAMSYDTFYRGMFERSRLLDIVKNFVCFSSDGVEDRKILGAYHQYYAVKRAAECAARAVSGDRKIGVFWHTQGSGKSLSMVFFAHLLQSALESPTIVVITDRNDLDNQLFAQFASCASFLRQTPVQAESREALRELLRGTKQNGIFFTTMQKFEEEGEPLSERRNIIVMADEAHRGQYGLFERVEMRENKDGVKTARSVKGFALLMREALPNASFIGFTGTPLSLKDRSTIEVFGDYIDIYDMTRAVQDGATRPVYYESRAVKLKLNDDALKAIDRYYDEQLTEGRAEEDAVDKSKRMMGTLESLLDANDAVQSLARDIIDHYEKNREHLLTGKAMIVCQSRKIAMHLYREIIALRPSWAKFETGEPVPGGQKIAVVMTETNQDPADWRPVTGNKARREALAKEFKDDESSLKIVIVVDMWLTGFDVPSLATMYFYKVMAGYSLMQAIARVNRVYRDKEGGLVVDYVGLATALKQAMKDYTEQDQKNFGDPDIAHTVYTKFTESLENCRRLLAGCDYSAFFGSDDVLRMDAISRAADFLLAAKKANDKKQFMEQSLLLKRARSLCSSILNERERLEAAFFEAVRTVLIRFDMQGRKKLSVRELNEEVSKLLQESINSTGVVPIISLPKDKGISLFDIVFLSEVAKMKQRNLARAMIEKILRGAIQDFKGRNIVRAGEFSEMMNEIMNAYDNGTKTNEEVIKELLALAEAIRAAREEGKELGLSPEEVAFYDALSKPQAVRDFYTNEQLVALTRELSDTLRKNRTVDWQMREDARAHMRMIVKRLLKKYKYPPDDAPGATATVLKQCEAWADRSAEDADSADEDGPDASPAGAGLFVAEPGA